MSIILHDYDPETQEILDGMLSLHEHSSKMAKKAIAMRFKILTDVYMDNQCKTFSNLCDIIDGTDLSRDLLTFQLVYFQSSFRSKETGKLFYLEDHNVIFAQDFDDLSKQVIKVLQITGWRGSGKTTIARHHLARQIAYAHRRNIGVIASDKDRAERIVRTVLDFFVRTETVSGKKQLTTFGKRFAGLLIPTIEHLDAESKKSLEHRFRAMSLTSGFSLANGVRIFPIAPNIGARGEATYEDRLDEGFGDDLEEAGEALSAKTRKTWRIMNSVLNAFTGDPDHDVIFSISGNRNNPEPESIFNRVIKRAAKNPLYRIRSLSVVDKDGKSTTIRKTDVEAQQFAKEAGADGTDRPEDNFTNPVMDVSNLSYINLSALQSKPAFRCAFIDLAFTKNNDSSETGVTLLYIPEDGKLWFGSLSFKAVGRSLINRIVRIVDDHKLNALTIERNLTGQVIPHWLQDEMAKQGIEETIVNDVVAPRTMKKTEKIGHALTLFDDTTMGFISELCNPLVEQMSLFNTERLKKSKETWDVLDSFSYAVQWFFDNKQKLTFHPFNRVETPAPTEMQYYGLVV